MTSLLKNSKLQLLHFVLQDMRLCIDLQNVSKVLPLVFLETIPSSPNYIVGLMNISGKSTPIIDLATRLGMKRHNKYSLDVPVLLCGDDKHEAGFVVDQILEIVDVYPNSLQMQDEFDKPTSFFSASVSLENELSLLINISRVLDVSLVQHLKSTTK